MDEEKLINEEEYQKLMNELNVWIKQTNEFIKRNNIIIKRVESRYDNWKKLDKKVKL